jgi:hypothetical protein
MLAKSDEMQTEAIEVGGFSPLLIRPSETLMNCSAASYGAVHHREGKTIAS